MKNVFYGILVIWNYMKNLEEQEYQKLTRYFYLSTSNCFLHVE